MAALPEPPDGTRIEFEYGTDVYAAWRNDAESARAGCSTGDGGETWVLYSYSVPLTWKKMCEDFGDSLATAVRLQPVTEDIPNREEWPTQVWAREQAEVGR